MQCTFIWHYNRKAETLLRQATKQILVPFVCTGYFVCAVCAYVHYHPYRIPCKIAVTQEPENNWMRCLWSHIFIFACVKMLGLGSFDKYLTKIVYTLQENVYACLCASPA